MSADSVLISNLLAAGRHLLRVGDDNVAARRRLTMCAVEVVYQDLLNAADTALASEPADLQDAVLVALEHAVEHPVVTLRNGEIRNARIFTVPVSQVLVDADKTLQALPAGAVLEQLLADTLSPSGEGILLNRMVSGHMLDSMSLKDFADLGRAAAYSFGHESAEAERLVQEAPAEVNSGLHFLIFIAFASAQHSEALLGLDGEDLAMRSLALMDCANDIVRRSLADLQVHGLGACVHLPQPLFYEPAVVDLAHECFLFATLLAGWLEDAQQEGHVVELVARLDETDDGPDVVVAALSGQHCWGEFRFSMDEGDDEMRNEICAAVQELARGRQLEVAFAGGLQGSAVEQPATMLHFAEAPATLH